MNSISQNIKIYRKQNNLTQQKLASRLGVTHQTISNWESGRSMPSIDTLADIAGKLDIDINFLLYGKKVDNTELKQQIKKNTAAYAVVLILWRAVRLYQKYREANGVNKFIHATMDMWYFLPARIFFCFFMPFMYILPAIILCKIFKYKGYVKNITDEKTFSIFKILYVFILVNHALSAIVTFDFTSIYGQGKLYKYLPAFLQWGYSRLHIISLSYPGLYAVMGVIYEMLRPFKNEKTIIHAYNPGRMNTIARNIKKLRTEKGLTQQQLAEKLFVTRQTISNWENGKIMPDVNMLMNISQDLETDLNSLLYYETATDRKTVFDFICTVIVIVAILALITARRIIRHNLPSYAVTWWQRAFMRLYMSVRGVLTRPVLYFTIPVSVIQIYKLCGRFTHFKGLKYRKLLAFVIVLFMVLTFYNYLPYMLKTDLKECFRMTEPVLWINYPSFDWLLPLPQRLSRTLYYICDNMRWLYSLLGIIFEISKPYGEREKK